MYHERSNEDKIENHGDILLLFLTQQLSSRLRQNQKLITYRVCNLIIAFTFQNGR